MSGRPAKPAALAVVVENIPSDLVAVDRWVVWRWTWKADKAKWDKPPLTVTGGAASSTEPTTWARFEVALDAYRTGKFDGVGFVLTDDDDLIGVDLDKCVADRVLDEWARQIVDRLDTYTEFSPSGTGVRCLLRGKLPPTGRRRGYVEMYENGRYMTITGQVIS